MDGPMDHQRLMDRPMDGLRDGRSTLQRCEDASKNQARQLIQNQSPKGKRWSSGTLALLSDLFMVYAFEICPSVHLSICPRIALACASLWRAMGQEEDAGTDRWTNRQMNKHMYKFPLCSTGLHSPLRPKPNQSPRGKKWSASGTLALPINMALAIRK